MNPKGYKIVLVLAGFIYIAVIAIRVAFYGYSRNGIFGFILGLVCGIVGGFLSAFIWVVLFTIIFKNSSSIFRWCKKTP